MIQPEARRAGSEQPPMRSTGATPTLPADRVLIRIPRLDTGPPVWLIVPLRRAIEQGAAALRRLAAGARLAEGSPTRRHAGWKRPAAWGAMATLVLVCVALGAYRGRSTTRDAMTTAPPFAVLPQSVDLPPSIDHPQFSDRPRFAAEPDAATDAPGWSSTPSAMHAGHSSLDYGPRAAANEPARAGYPDTATAAAGYSPREYPSTAQPHGEYPVAGDYVHTDYRDTAGPSGDELAAAYPATSYGGHDYPATSSDAVSAVANYPASIPLVASLPVPRRPRPERRDSHAHGGPAVTGTAREHAASDAWSPAAAPEYRTAVAPAAGASGEANAPAALAPPAARIDRGIVIERQQGTSR